MGHVRGPFIQRRDTHEGFGYNPINQILGYLISGDPAYITSYNNARSDIRRLERDDLIEELLKEYAKAKQL